ncbi:ubiquitin-domain-containing protein [Thozetella sp. PMI_491]|nr:ubiquitin-domain-containing protein [Thozetella sp. PMI_491]
MTSMHRIRHQARAAAWSRHESLNGFNPYFRTGRGGRREWDGGGLEAQDAETSVWGGRVTADSGAGNTAGAMVLPPKSNATVTLEEAAPDRKSAINEADSTELNPGALRKRKCGTSENEPVGEDAQSIWVYVQSLFGKEVTLQVDPSDTVLQLKQKIQDRESVAPSRQRLKFQGQILANSVALSDCGIRRGSTVHFALLGPPPFAFHDPPSTTVASQLRLLFVASWAHILLLAIPVGFVINYLGSPPAAVFVVNFIAVIPSSINVSVALDELMLRVGDVLGALLDMTFSNVVQLVTSIFLLRNNQVAVLKTSLVGAMLSDLLLMSGLSFFVGGIRRYSQFFSAVSAQALTSMLLLVVVGLMIPTVCQRLAFIDDAGILKQSRGASILFLASYMLWLYYQLYTHRVPPDMMFAPSKKVKRRLGGLDAEPEPEPPEDEDMEEAQLTYPFIAATLAIFITLLAFNIQFAADSIDFLLQDAGLTPTFIGLVILPILNIDPTVLVVARRDKLDLSIALTVGKCIQIALGLVPTVMIVAWGMGNTEMDLVFGVFEVVIVFVSVLVVCQVVDRGQSDWLQGALLVQAYILVAVASYFVQ